MLSRLLDKVLRWSDVVDKEALCIKAGERVRIHSAPARGPSADTDSFLFVDTGDRCGTSA